MKAAFFDIDGTLTNINDWMIKRAVKYAENSNIKLNVYDEFYTYDKMFDWSEDDLQSFLFENFKDYLTEEMPDDNSAEILDKLKEEGHEIIFVTARGTYEPELKVVDADLTDNLTMKWLDKNNYHYDKVVIRARNKIKALEEEKLDMFIDDVDTNVYALSKYIPVIVLSRKYNTSVQGENITRANSWDEIYKIIKSM